MLKKIVQINTVINSGSTGRIAEEIGVKAIKAGWVSYIAYGRNDRPSDSKKIKIGNDWDIKWHGIQTRIFDSHGFASRRATSKFIEQLKVLKPSIVHLHNLHGYYLNLDLLFNYLANADVPVVWTLHDCWSFTGHCTYFSFVNCDKWKTHCHHCPQTNEYPESWFLDNSFNNFSLKHKLFTSVKNMTLVPVSNWLASIVNDSYLKNFPVKVINNGVDLDIFKPMNTDVLSKELGIQDKFILLGVAFLWNERKGLNDFKDLSKNLNEDEIIIIVGLTKKQIQELPTNIIGLEKTENIQKLVHLYSLADVVLNLSVEETFGMTTVEGFACGTPGIVYNTTASPELITPDTGEIIEKHNMDQLRIAIDNIKYKGKIHYFNACIDRAKRLYNKDDRFEEYLELYENLLSN